MKFYRRTKGEVNAQIVTYVNAYKNKDTYVNTDMSNSKNMSTILIVATNIHECIQKDSHI